MPGAPDGSAGGPDARIGGPDARANAPDGGGGAPDAAGRAPDAGGAPDGGSVGLATVHFVGRVDLSTPATPRYAWSGTTALARFDGTGISVALADGYANQFAVYVDGAVTPKAVKTSGDATYVLASGLRSGTHDVALVKRTEAFQGEITFKGFTVTGGALIATADPTTRTIEFIGDSITAGYGVDGAGPNCGFSADTENEDIAYGALTARALGAGHAAIAWSGIGVYQDGSGSKTDQMPVRYLRTLPDESASTVDFGRQPPDVIVVNLGTNDFAHGDPGQPFTDAYTAFLATLRAHHPGVPILAALSPMLDGTARDQAGADIAAAVKARNDGGDALVQTFDFGVQSASDGYGCDYHPSPTTHQKMASKLVPVIRALKGW